jgi:hypothetical protein
MSVFMLVSLINNLGPAQKTAEDRRFKLTVTHKHIRMNGASKNVGGKAIPVNKPLRPIGL